MIDVVALSRRDYETIHSSGPMMSTKVFSFIGCASRASRLTRGRCLAGRGVSGSNWEVPFRPQRVKVPVLRPEDRRNRLTC